MSTQDGTAIVVKADDATGLAAIQRALNEADDVVLHHALHDLPILAEIGLIVPDEKIRDTMCQAYLLGLEPQGLKALAYRHCGMTMGDYTDLTAVSDERVARTWLTDVALGLPDPPALAATIHHKKCVLFARSMTFENGSSVTFQSTPAIPCTCPKGWPKAPKLVLGPEQADLANARKLVLRMLSKHEGKPLRARWAASRAQEILEDELAMVGPMPLPTLDDVIVDHDGDDTAVIEYAGADADATRRLAPILQAQIDAYGLTDVCRVTTGIIPMIDRMQRTGILVDLDHIRALEPIFSGKAEQLDAAITAMIGRPINANSGDQVAELLFDQMKLHKAVPNLRLKRTQGGTRFVTNDKTLEALAGVHPIIALLRNRREMTKLLGSYVRTIPGFVDPADGRLHCEFLLTRTDTGRLAAKNPNLLAWPKHSEDALLIRHGFVAGPGHELGEWDLDQIEMRVFAHDAGEVNMLTAFAAGIDLHTSTASLIFGRPVEVIATEYKAKAGAGGDQRFAAKAVNFGILMGITEYGLMAQFHKNGQLHWTVDDCWKLLGDWALAYPSGTRYIQSKHEEARRHSYVRDLFGRMRWLDGVHSEDDYIRAEAERMAQATPTQSGAQGVMQRAMLNMWPDLQRLRRRFWVEPLLQTHDALMFEYDQEHRTEVNDLVLHHLSNAVTLTVPITAKGTFGYTWGDL